MAKAKHKTLNELANEYLYDPRWKRVQRKNKHGRTLYSRNGNNINVKLFFYLTMVIIYVIVMVIL